MFHPDFEEFKIGYEAGNTVRIHGRFLGDTLTPISAFFRLQRGPYAALLESVTGGENVGRYSFIGTSPVAIFRSSGSRVEISENGQTREFESEDPLNDLWELTQRYTPVVPDELPRLAGGAIGYVAYDAIRYVEHLPHVPPDDLGVPDLYFCIYDTMLIFDNVDKSLRIVTNVFPGSGEARDAYQAAVSRIEEMAELLSTEDSAHVEPIRPTGELERDYDSSFRREDFLRSVEQCKEYIRAGDIFQVVLSQRFHARTTADSFNIYRALRTINPSPYMFYLTFGDLKLVGASPEVMVRVEEGLVTVRPIAGTRRRGRTAEDEAAMEKELLSDPKEIAEHVMLLDLGRNDVGRICSFNTVKVTETMGLEKYSHVMHMTSNVEGRLAEEQTAMDALRACFPAGTVSGAPKIRAMEILDELEPTKRGPYAGAVGYLDFAGNMDTCIAIRTIVINGEDAYVQAGAGIVADSKPELEFLETQNKAKALLKAIDVAERQLGL